MLIHRDCRQFLGHIPCRPHKLEGVHCDGCKYYDKADFHVLIIKLGAIGDVIRTTPLLRRLKVAHPNAFITWLTLTPEVLPASVDRKMGFELKNIVTLMAHEFDLLINLDKDLEACALASQVKAKMKKGFIMAYGKPVPLDAAARPKYLTGLFDDVNKANTHSYPQEIFEICGYEFAGEKYILELPKNPRAFPEIPQDARVIGLNTGCGGRWTARLWADERWVALAKGLKSAGYYPLFLGGEQEHEKNLRLAAESGGAYMGHFSLPDFFCLMNRCELVVTAVTMSMHIAIGLGKKLVLFNNIFNPFEFEMYGLGEIVMPPELACSGCFKPFCERNCMEGITVEMTLEAVERLMKL